MTSSKYCTWLFSNRLHEIYIIYTAWSHLKLHNKHRNCAVLPSGKPPSWTFPNPGSDILLPLICSACYVSTGISSGPWQEAVTAGAHSIQGKRESEEVKRWRLVLHLVLQVGQSLLLPNVEPRPQRCPNLKGILWQISVLWVSKA